MFPLRARARPASQLETELDRYTRRCLPGRQHDPGAGAWQNPRVLAERITAFVRGEPGAGFEELALAAFGLAYERSAPYRELCDGLGVGPEGVTGWRQAPAMPAEDAAALDPASPAADGEEVAAASQLLRAVIDRSFPAACLEGLERPPVLALTPSGAERPGSALGFTTSHLLRAWAAPDSTVACGPRGVEVPRARSFLAARQRDRRPTLILTSPAALARLVAALEQRGLRFRLPPGSRVVVAGSGGLAGRKMLGRLADSLAVPPELVIRAWAVGGLRSWLYAGHDPRGEPHSFRPPPWTRVRIFDPRTLAAPAPGAPGSISVFDLAALGAPPHRLSGELAVAGEDGFRLVDGG